MSWLRARLQARSFGVVAASVTLVVLMLVVIAGSLASDHAAARAQRAVLLNTAYQKAAVGVAAEESLERKYRLEPGPVPFGRARVRPAPGG